MVTETPVSDTQAEGITPSDATQPGHPNLLMRVLYAGLMLFMFAPMQLIVGVPLIIAAGLIALILNPDFTPVMLLESDLALWLSVIAAAIASVLTIASAALWPRFISRDQFTAEQWTAWRQPRHIKTWMTVLGTIVMLGAVGVGIASLFEESDVELQMMLFSTPGLGILSALIVTTVVPISEELVFRGALYNLLLPQSDAKPLPIKAHIVPFLVVTLVFGLAHLLAGFENIGSIVQVVILSAFLTTLRTVSGSVKPSILAHALWNGAAAFGMLATTYFPF